MMIPVRDIKLNNQEFLDIVNEYKDVVMARNNPDDRPRIAQVIPIKEKDETLEEWTSDEYLDLIMKQGREHDGYPRKLKGYSGLKYTDYMEGRGAERQLREGADIYEATSKLNRRLVEFLSCANNALNAVYPPGGFIAWHNNANAAGYNIICTWSENGDGWFDYWDLDKKERVRVPDVPGWQAKMTYFGSYDQPDKICYHAAGTNCYRITVAFVFKEADNFWEEVIEDLENPL